MKILSLVLLSSLFACGPKPTTAQSALSDDPDHRFSAFAVSRDYTVKAESHRNASFDDAFANAARTCSARGGVDCFVKAGTFAHCWAFAYSRDSGAFTDIYGFSLDDAEERAQRMCRPGDSCFLWHSFCPATGLLAGDSSLQHETNYFGAVAFSPQTERYALVTDRNDLDDARDAALAQCGAGDCGIAMWAQNGDCLAGYEGDSAPAGRPRFGFASGADLQMTRDSARKICEFNTQGRCRQVFGECLQSPDMYDRPLDDIYEYEGTFRERLTMKFVNVAPVADVRARLVATLVRPYGSDVLNDPARAARNQAAIDRLLSRRAAGTVFTSYRQLVASVTLNYECLNAIEATADDYYDAEFTAGYQTDDEIERYEGTSSERTIIAFVNDASRTPDELGASLSLRASSVAALWRLRREGGCQSVRQLGIALEPRIEDFRKINRAALGAD